MRLARDSCREAQAAKPVQGVWDVRPRRHKIPVALQHGHLATGISLDMADEGNDVTDAQMTFERVRKGVVAAQHRHERQVVPTPTGCLQRSAMKHQM